MICGAGGGGRGLAAVGAVLRHGRSFGLNDTAKLQVQVEAGVANTGQSAGQERATWRVLTRGVARAGVLDPGIGHLLPVSRREIDHTERGGDCGRAASGGTARRTGGAAARSAGATPNRSVRKPGRNSSTPASTVRNPPAFASMTCRSRSRSGLVGVRDSDAQPGNLAAPSPTQRQHARQCRGEHQRQRPKHPNEGSNKDEYRDFGDRKEQDDGDNPFYHGGFPAAGEVGAAAGIVYGRPWHSAGLQSADAPLDGRSRVLTL